MDAQVLTVSSKGQISLPVAIRKMLSKDMDMSAVLEAHVVKSKEINERLAHGVGSKEVSSILKKLCV